MRILWIVCALAVLGIAGALSLVLLRARALKARHLRAFGGAGVEPQPDKERLIDSPRALYHGTRFADGAAVLVAAWAEECVADLWCTADAVFLQREGGGRLLFIPLADVAEAELHRAHANLAGKDLPMIRLRWRKGGEQLVTELSMQGGMANLERLRREIHLRQTNVAEQLAPLLAQKP